MSAEKQPIPILRFFNSAHLPSHLQEIAKPFENLANHMAETLPVNAELIAGLRKLLEAKDCAIRASLP